MADRSRRKREDQATDSSQSIFDLFDPPPERDHDTFGKIPVIKAEDEVDLTDGSEAEIKAAADAEAAGLQHWTAPPTGQIPAVLGTEIDPGRFGDMQGPSWQGENPSWSGPELTDVMGDAEAVRHDYLGYDDDDETEPVYQALQAPAPVAQRDPNARRPSARPAQPQTQQPSQQQRPSPAATPSSTRQPVARGRGEQQPPPRVRPAQRGGTPPPEIRQTAPRETKRGPVESAPQAGVPSQPIDGGSRSASARNSLRAGSQLDAGTSSDQEVTAPGLLGERDQIDRSAPSGRRRPAAKPVAEFDDEDLDEVGLGKIGGRNLPLAIGVGVGLAAVVLAAMYFGPGTTMALVAAVSLLAVLELYSAMRMAGLKPATLLGLVGTVAIPAATYYRGDAAFPMIVGLAVVFSALWYLVGADFERPVLNMSLTMMGIFWVGGLAGFAGLMLREQIGLELLLFTIMIVVASDTMAYLGGKTFGSRQFHHASPNKTWEGTLIGFAAAVFTAFALGVTEAGTIFDDAFMPAVILGVVVGVLAPMGDLAESLVKRDLGVKDMGTLLPGHGGVLDRVDGMLFALPGAYYLALVFELF